MEMKTIVLLSCVLTVTTVAADWPPIYTNPEQVHLALGGKSVTWKNV